MWVRYNFCLSIPSALIIPVWVSKLTQQMCKYPNKTILFLWQIRNCATLKTQSYILKSVNGFCEPNCQSKISRTTFINCLQTDFPLWPVYRMISGGEPASTDYNIVFCWWLSSVLNQENCRNLPARGVHTSARHTFTEFIIQPWKHVARRHEIVRRNDWLPQKYSCCACLVGAAVQQWQWR